MVLVASTDGPPPGLDPIDCERELIHTPGAIQPHGALLAVLADRGTVTHASANLSSILGRPAEAVLGQPVEHVLGKAAGHVLLSAKPGEKIALSQDDTPTDANGQTLHLHAYWTGRHIAIDIEPANPDPGQKLPLTVVQSILETFEKATSQLHLCQLAIRGLQALTGFERVMVYRLDKQGHGEVVAEIHAASLEPYLGNKYPTTDIPTQARRLLLDHRVGSVADSSYRPVPLLVDPALDDDIPLDLTHSTLRSVSPIHREYLRNMKTAASISISLVSGSELWGFLLCHHATPRIAGPDLRAAVDMVGRVVSVLLGGLGDAEVYAQRNARNDTLRTLVDRLAAPLPLAAAMAAAAADLLHLVNASGAVIRIAGTLSRIGSTPPADAAEQAAAVMQLRAAGELLAVDDLALVHPELAACTEAGSGALLLPLSQDGDDLILWFRPEHSRIVTWAGDPNQKATREPSTGQISPRASFAAWKQTTAGRSKPWTTADLALAAELRTAFEQEMARRARAELVWLRHYQDLSDSLELKVGERTKALEIETSERLRAEATLHQAQKMEAIGQLTGGVAHDFNNVLAAVLGNVELAQASTTEPVTLRQLSNVQQAAERGAKLTDHLLSFARKQPLSKETCDINLLVARFHGLINRTIGSSVLVQLDLAPDLWRVMADPVQFEMALLNLAVNARDAMAKGGKLTIATTNVSAPSPGMPDDLPPGDYACIMVRDTGSGMGDDVARRVFEPFFTTKRPGEGTGLGLSQVYGFCKQLNGSTILTSKLGAGTSVSLFLPRTIELAPSLPPPQPILARAAAPARPAASRVLVVDDDWAVLSMVSEMLKALGFDVVAAESGMRGVEILTSSVHVDLVLTDFSMPVMNGIEFIRQARQLQPGLPCLMMTGYADVGNFADAAADDIPILRKPYKMKDLATNIQHLQKRADAGALSRSIH